MHTPSGGSTFEERFAYARWLFHGLRGAEPSQTELANRVGRKQPTVGEWYTRQKPPADWEVHEPFASYLGVTTAWLIRDAEPAPEPTLWGWWIVQRRKHRAPSKGTATHRVAKPAATDEGKGGKKRRAG